jgi:hypothetical protein
MPALQAAATVVILDKQKDHYNELSLFRIALIDKAVKNFVASVNAQLASGAFRDAYGSVPEAVLYEPVDVKELGISHPEESLAGLPAAQRYMEAANRIMEQDSIVRMMVLDARYPCDIEAISCTINEMLNGRLPVGDVVEIVKDNAELAALNGRIGNTYAMTARDLGISRLRAKVAGQAMMDGQIDRLNKVAPREQMASVRDFLQTPAGRMSLALSEASLIQQSLQNQANSAAAGDPTKYAELQTRLQEAVMVLANESQKGNLINQFAPNVSALLAPAINSISEALIGSGTSMDPRDADYKTNRNAQV